jgi:3-carboxy-cis,cis-muconate cycloisomerase
MSFTLPGSSFLNSLLGDAEIAAYFSEEADLRAMLQFELALANAEESAGLIPAGSAAVIARAADTFVPDLAAISRGVERDGMVVPDLIRQLRERVGAPHNIHLHFGSTSQDVIDTSFMLRMREAARLLAARLHKIIGKLDSLAAAHGSNRLMARTRMQAAIPIIVADRIRNWREPLEHAQTRLDMMAPRVFALQFGGPAGTLDAFGDKAAIVTEEIARRLDLAAPSGSWHVQRDRIVDIADWLSLVTTALGKIGQDAALMAQNEIAEITLGDAGTSSAMHHKKNPVKAEVLVSLARFNATLVAGMHQAAVHEQERSGAAWTLEWMLLPQMAVAAGASTRLAASLLDSVERIGALRDGSV